VKSSISKSEAGTGSGRAGDGVEIGPGKRTLTEGLPPVQASPASGGLAATGPSPAGSGAGTRARPSPLGVAQNQMERAFGLDFSDVRVHQDGAAEAMGAQAFTQGNDLHFANGAFDPASQSGQSLIGHELAHVVQQREGRVASPQGKGGNVVVDHGLEAEADQAGAVAARGEPVSLGASSATGAGGAQAKAAGDPIQLFDAMEHKRMGDKGSGGKQYEWPTSVTAPLSKESEPFRFVLSHGDIVMLSGDLFDARKPPQFGDKAAELDMGKGKVADRDLFSYCSTPSSVPGHHVGTQDEVIYAIYNENPNDPRFMAPCTVDGMGSIWHGITFSDEVKLRVKARYDWLAYNNIEHFVEPSGPGSGGPGSGARKSAGGSYRAMHEEAIQRAYQAKQDRTSLDPAMTYEAAAEHFLTDSFSAGHQRTQRQGITDYWGKKYPLFFESFKHTIARDIAIGINRRDTNVATLLGTVGAIEDSVLPTLAEKTRNIPPVGFDVVINKLVHDTDNDAGLWVVSEVHPDGWKTMGDGNAPSGSLTEARAAEAVQLGVGDIKAANTLPAGLTPEQVRAEVKARTPAPAKTGALYGAEQAMPRLDPSHAGNAAGDNGAQQWQQADFGALWNTQIRSGKQAPKDGVKDGAAAEYPTFGKAIEDSVRSGAIGSQVDGLADQIDPSQKVYKAGVYLGTVHPKAAFISDFAGKLKESPRVKLEQIVNFDPARGITWVQTDNAVMDEMKSMDDKDTADGNQRGTRERGLTTAQRGSWIHTLVHGTFNRVTSDEAQRVVEMFQTAPAAERAKIYRLVEGHDWQGHFVHGAWVSDDDIWNGLGKAQLKKVEALINEGRGGK